MLKQLGIILNRGGFLTDKIFIDSEVLATRIAKHKILLLKQVTSEIDKVVVDLIDCRCW